MSKATDMMNALGVKPLEKVHHLARKVREDGAVSPWCAKRPRALNLAKELWTLREEGTTCAKCLKAKQQFKPYSEQHPTTTKGQP